MNYWFKIWPEHDVGRRLGELLARLLCRRLGLREVLLLQHLEGLDQSRVRGPGRQVEAGLAVKVPDPDCGRISFVEDSGDFGVTSGTGSHLNGNGKCRCVQQIKIFTRRDFWPNDTFLVDTCSKKDQPLEPSVVLKWPPLTNGMESISLENI